MSTITIVSDFHNSRSPKCISCIYYEFKNKDWLSGVCTNDTAKIKSKSRYHNSKGCSQHRRIKEEDFQQKLNPNVNENK